MIQINDCPRVCDDESSLRSHRYCNVRPLNQERKTMNLKILAGMLAVGAATVPSIASAQDDAGRIQIKAFATVVLPDGGITAVNTDIEGLSGNGDLCA
ncbi:hypothetical protein QQS45_02915 [Alteriqipengyuania flavescens]|uniref:hypothetical protein n=1 Tax=Alteriqipengyuania flavescens TaxID=3053610 RepID=UPI0025B2FDBA|nr:hypothetical protein [Alteriqipengyuania flavescens]WJY19201.1 hypothetical protein QQW98_02910 [Alteriqipengyuania flavescens]WJY25141.1 hypothetical protein QQS45_02915 [Alteriqipengyuania flavescens]